RRILADDQGGRSMGIDVIGAILRVVLDDEDGGVVPVGTVGEGIDYAAYRQIVVGDRGLRRGLAGTRASGVVVGQVEERELRKFFGASLGFHELGEFAEEFVGAELVGIVGVEVGKLRIVVIAQSGFGGPRALHLGNCPRPGARAAARVADVRG